MLNQEIYDKLHAPMDERRVHEPVLGAFGSYLEAWDVIDTANRIFGYDGWSFHILKRDVIQATDRRGEVTGALVAVEGEITALGVTRQDIGTNAVTYRTSDGNASPEAWETTLKGAASDCLKRCLRTFGEQFGLMLYDKDRLRGPLSDLPPDAATPPPPHEGTDTWYSPAGHLYRNPQHCPEHQKPWAFWPNDGAPHCTARGGQQVNARGYCTRVPEPVWQSPEPAPTAHGAPQTAPSAPQTPRPPNPPARTTRGRPAPSQGPERATPAGTRAEEGKVWAEYTKQRDQAGLTDDDIARITLYTETGDVNLFNWVKENKSQKPTLEALIAWLILGAQQERDRLIEVEGGTR